ncbi:carotenoid oxygenase family protein [Nocardia cyriacigeorgica]|uniref:carotenoid oxygenase family protein n=1 Tax=Nocardia cyriacigeorgica TaxID=135487 RepID=UPI002453BF3A|nr:carotenoid oxygenase family protein [Nocardia cyriacigeorgica]
MANMYLDGNFAPVQQELTAFDLPVTGTIPDFLDGRYVRNGPNPIGEVDPDTYHWFMGDGMVHGVRLAEGNARWYRNRWVRVSDPANPRKHRAGIELFGANTNVIGHAGKTLALIEGGMANYELDEELDTVGPCDFDGTLPGGYTAHPHRDPVTGELHAITHFFGRGDIVQYSVIDVRGRARRIVDIPIRGVPMMHDFSLTEKYVVLYDLPVTFDPGAAAAMTMPRPLRYPTQLLLSALIGRVRVPDPITAMVGRRMRPNDRLPARWNPAHPARVGLLPREGEAADIRWFDVSPCYVFHPLNAYDDGDTVVLDVVRHPRMFVTDRNGPDEGPTTLDRWVVDPRAGAVRETRLDDRSQEFPRIDERLVGRKHRYGYTMEALGGGSPAGALFKHDLLTGATIEKRLGPGIEPSEFSFVPSRPDAAEDEGVLMGYQYNAGTRRSDLLILDAQTMSTIATVHLPDRVPNGFHGSWIPTTDA